MNQLSSFLPAVFEAFGNQSADVRKVNKTNKELKIKTSQKLDFSTINLSFVICVFVADGGVLSGRHIYNAWESILAVFGRFKQHTGSASDHLRKQDLTS